MAKFPTYNITGNAYWARVQKDFPNDKFTPCWTIDVANLTDAQKADLGKQGLSGKIKNKGDDRGDFISIKQNTMIINRKEGTTKEAFPPKVIDKEGRPFEGLIGNGSKVTVQYQVREADDPKYTGVDLKAVQVLELVEYKPDDEDVVDLDNLPLTAAG